MKYTIKHGACCTKTDEEIIHGDSLKDALSRYVQECFSINSSCDIEVIDDCGTTRQFLLMKSVRCDVWEENPPNELHIEVS